MIYRVYLKQEQSEITSFIQQTSIDPPLDEGESLPLYIDGKDTLYRVLKIQGPCVDVRYGFAFSDMLVEEIGNPAD